MIGNNLVEEGNTNNSFKRKLLITMHVALIVSIATTTVMAMPVYPS
jgi:hypothetical protein